MTIFNVSTTAGLYQALGAAQAGDIVKLAPGAYSGVNIQNINFSSAVTITSANALSPAVVTDIKVYNCNGLTFNNLELSTAGAPIGPYGAAATTEFNFIGDTNLILSNLNVHGDPNGTLATDVSGIIFQNCDTVTLRNSNFSHLHYAVEHINCNNVTISGNSFDHIWDDGIRGGGTSNLTIRVNTFTDMHEDPSDTDHPDCIQLWTANTTSSAQNITITGNTYTRGDGGPVQGIFINDEVGGLPFQNVTISNNSLTGSLWDGIYLDDVEGATVKNNVITSYTDQESWFSITNSDSVKLTNNAAVAYIYGNDTNFLLSGNLINTPISPPTQEPLSSNFLSGHTVNTVGVVGFVTCMAGIVAPSSAFSAEAGGLTERDMMQGVVGQRQLGLVHQ